MKNYLIGIGIGLVLGILATIYIGDFSSIDLKKELTLGEFTNILITVLLALIIPISINKWLEDNKSVKELFGFEIDSSISALKDIKSVIEKSYTTNTAVLDADKKQITFLFKILDNKIAFLVDRLSIDYIKESVNIIQDINTYNVDYWKEVTGGNLMNAGFVIDDNFMRLHINSYAKIENVLKRAKYEINEY